MLNFASNNRDMFIFFGVLIGYAIRSTSPLLLDLHPIVWKQVNKSKLTEDDLKSSDLYRFQMLEQIKKVERDQFDLMID
jgi:HECT-domain (ubiquitin-transferase)